MSLWKVDKTRSIVSVCHISFDECSTIASFFLFFFAFLGVVPSLVDIHCVRLAVASADLVWENSTADWLVTGG